MRHATTGNGRAELLQYPSGDTVRILVDSRASERALAVLDCTHVAGPAERHVHADAHKSVFVLAGRYRFAVGDHVVEARPGDQVFIRRGVPHDFVVGIEGGRALFVFSPGGVEDYFRALATMADTGSSPVSIGELRRRYHIEPDVEPRDPVAVRET
jgi:quercetin dioxygenase-like cupin family protein